MRLFSVKEARYPASRHAWTANSLVTPKGQQKPSGRRPVWVSMAWAAVRSSSRTRLRYDSSDSSSRVVGSKSRVTIHGSVTICPERRPLISWCDRAAWASMSTTPLAAISRHCSHVSHG